MCIDPILYGIQQSMLMCNLKAYKSGKNVKCHKIQSYNSNCAYLKHPTQGIHHGYGN